MVRDPSEAKRIPEIPAVALHLTSAVLFTQSISIHPLNFLFDFCLEQN
jgi:hypothetical protein